MFDQDSIMTIQLDFYWVHIKNLMRFDQRITSKTFLKTGKWLSYKNNSGVSRGKGLMPNHYKQLYGEIELVETNNQDKFQIKHREGYLTNSTNLYLTSHVLLPKKWLIL